MEFEVPTVYVGKKNMTFYLNVCLKLLDRGYKELILEAMGNNISKAVSVANFLKELYGKNNIVFSDIKIDLVEGENVRGVPRKISRIRIHVTNVSSNESGV